MVIITSGCINQKDIYGDDFDNINLNTTEFHLIFNDFHSLYLIYEENDDFYSLKVKSQTFHERVEYSNNNNLLVRTYNSKRFDIEFYSTETGKITKNKDFDEGPHNSCGSGDKILYDTSKVYSKDGISYTKLYVWDLIEMDYQYVDKVKGSTSNFYCFGNEAIFSAYNSEGKSNIYSYNFDSNQIDNIIEDTFLVPDIFYKTDDGKIYAAYSKRPKGKKNDIEKIKNTLYVINGNELEYIDGFDVEINNMVVIEDMVYFATETGIYGYDLNNYNFERVVGGNAMIVNNGYIFVFAYDAIRIYDLNFNYIDLVLVSSSIPDNPVLIPVF